MYEHNSYPDGDERAYIGRFNAYIEKAQRRSIPFELTLQEFVQFAKQPCTYCGAQPGLKVRKERVRRASPMMNGIDRVDNTKGYCVGNCAPCCTWCNEMKLDRTAAAFLAHVEKIVNWQTR